jgi:transposase InsO family protein
MNNLEKLSKFSQHTRVLTVERVTKQKWPVTRAAQAIGASRSIVYRWLRRFAAEGSSGLADHSSRPLCSPRRFPQDLVDAIKALRENGLSLSRIMAQLGLVRSTVWRWLKRLSLNRLPRPTREVPLRYEAAVPGELLHIDIKKLRGFDYAGRKFIDDGGRRLRGAPRRYLHVCIDSHSRYAFARILERENAEACITFLAAAREHFASQGVTVKRILTDNASAYRGVAMRAYTEQIGIRHSFTKVRRPQTNGKAERFIRSAMTEWGYLRYETSADRDAALPSWIAYYNHERNHSSIGFKPPVSRICAQPVET